MNLNVTIILLISFVVSNIKIIFRVLNYSSILQGKSNEERTYQLTILILIRIIEK
jgi:hypothetical protein